MFSDAFWHYYGGWWLPPAPGTWPSSRAVWQTLTWGQTRQYSVRNDNFTEIKKWIFYCYKGLVFMMWPRAASMASRASLMSWSLYMSRLSSWSLKCHLYILTLSILLPILAKSWSCSKSKPCPKKPQSQIKVPPKRKGSISLAIFLPFLLSSPSHQSPVLTGPISWP